MPTRIGSKLRAIFRRSRVEAEMQEEMVAHLDQAVERLKARGLSEDEARRTALREFGNVPSLQEEARDARGGRWIESLVADTRFAFRTFRKTPLATATIVLILALGLGANTAFFTFVHSILTLPAPGIPQNDALVRIRATENFGNYVNPRSMSYPEFLEYAERADLFSATAAWSQTNVLFEAGQDGSVSFNASAQLVTSEYFFVLGTTPILGPGLPDFGAEMDDPLASTLAVVISHAIWEENFGRSPDVIGRTVRVNHLSATIVGVAPPRFLGVSAPALDNTIWLPLGVLPLLREGSGSIFASYDSTMVQGVVARLQPRIPMEDASREASAISERATARMTPLQQEEEAVYALDVVPLRASNSSPARERSEILEILPFGLLSLLILAIVCTNVAALLATAALGRRREIALRLALGSERGRVVRQLLTESILRAIIAGALGALVLAILIRGFGDQISNTLDLFDPEIFLFIFGIALATGILLGLLPSLHATRSSIADDLRSSASTVAGTRSRLPRAFVVAQITLTQPILAGIATFLFVLMPGLAELRPSEIDEHLLHVVPGSAIWSLSEEEQESVLSQLRERIGGIPGVTGVIPYSGLSSMGPREMSVHPEDRIEGVTPTGPLWIQPQPVAADYFDLMNMPMVLGEVPSSDVGTAAGNRSQAVIGSVRARELWGDANPIGRRLLSEGGEELVVTGVVDENAAAFRESAVDGSAPIYTVSSIPIPTLLVRTESPAESMVREIRRIVREVVPDIGEPALETLAQTQGEYRSLITKLTSAAVAGGALALLLSGIGLYSVVSTTVKRRSNEIGIRSAMGATPRGILKIFLMEGVRMGGFGLLLGLPLSLVLLRILAQIEIRGLETVLILAAGTFTALIVLSVTLLASWLPARRAASVDPMTVLRVE